MKNLWIIILIIATAGCTDQSQVTEMNRLQKEKQKLFNEAAKKSEDIAVFKQYLEDIEKDLLQVAQSQGDLSALLLNPELDMNADNIKVTVDALSAMLDNNRKKISKLQGKLEHNIADLAAYKVSLELLQSNLDQKTDQVMALNDSLLDKDIAISILVQGEQELSLAISQLEKKMNTAWYVSGSFDELKTAEIAHRKGGFLGIGGAKVISSEAATNYFTAIDMYETQVIPFEGDKVELISNHPADSYKIEKNNDSFALHILDPDLFWNQTKQLAMVTK